MSQPASLKWIPPFREILVRGFQTLPLTLAGTSAFFAATTTAPFFVVLTVVLVAVLPVLISLWQIVGSLFTGSPNKLFAVAGGLASLGGLLGLILQKYVWPTPSSTGFFTLTRFLEIVSLLGLFFMNAHVTPSSPTSLSPSLPCNLIGMTLEKRPAETKVPIAPSFWITPITFLSVYLFHNAYDNYNRDTPEGKEGEASVKRRKIQSVFALLSIPIITVILLWFRMTTGCETAISLLSSLFLGTFVAEYFYDMARDSGVDAFQMFQNLQMSVKKRDYRCMAEI